MRLTNGWNRLVYRAWAPIYDRVLEETFLPGRTRSLELLALKPGERLLIPGVGTGMDLPLLPQGVQALGIDLSPAMLARARAKLPLPGREIELREGDAQALPVESGAFDAALLHLILAVVPDGRLCLQEALRALRPGGRVAVFDKFLPEGTAPPPPSRRLTNAFTTLIGTDVNRRFGELARGLPCEVVRDEPSVMRGVYRVLLLRRT